MDKVKNQLLEDFIKDFDKYFTNTPYFNEFIFCNGFVNYEQEKIKEIKEQFIEEEKFNFEHMI